MNYKTHIRVRATGVIIENNSVLLVEYNAEPLGVHYVLPGGGVEPGETVIEAVRREVKEEICVDVEVGSLILAHEYVPHLDPYKRPVPHAISLYFECKIIGDSTPKLPEKPDQYQTGVRWVSIDELDSIVLSPCIKPYIKQYLENRNGIEFLQEHKL